MALNISVSQKGNIKNPESLENGDVLRVLASLSGVVPVAEQISDPAGQFSCLEKCLLAEYGAGQLSDTSPPNPFQYKYIWVEGEGWKRVCCWIGSLELSFSNASVVSIGFESGTAYAESTVSASQPQSVQS